METRPRKASKAKISSWVGNRLSVPLVFAILAAAFPFGLLIWLDPLYLNIESGAASWTQLLLASLLTFPGLLLLLGGVLGRKPKLFLTALAIMAISGAVIYQNGLFTNPPTTATPEVFRFAEEKRIAALECIANDASVMSGPTDRSGGSRGICIGSSVSWRDSGPGEFLNRGAPIGWRYRGYNERHPQEGMFFFSLISREGTIISCDQIRCEIEREGIK